MKLGSIRDKRFEPDQGLAMALKKDEALHAFSFRPDDTNIYKYLNGESLDIPSDKGWHLICAHENPLGWAKSDGRRLKNKMAKGWINN